MKILFAGKYFQGVKNDNFFKIAELYETKVRATKPKFIKMAFFVKIYLWSKNQISSRNLHFIKWAKLKNLSQKCQFTKIHILEKDFSPKTQTCAQMFQYYRVFFWANSGGVI